MLRTFSFYNEGKFSLLLMLIFALLLMLMHPHVQSYWIRLLWEMFYMRFKWFIRSFVLVTSPTRFKKHSYATDFISNVIILLQTSYSTNMVMYWYDILELNLNSFNLNGSLWLIISQQSRATELSANIVRRILS